MHDLDRTQEEFYDEYSGYEYEADAYEFEADYEDEYEYDDEYSDEFEYDFEAVFDEADELELAAELLEITDEDELDQFIGKLIKKAARKVKKAVKSPIGRRIGGMLKGVAKKALPKLGAVAGNFLLPGVGGAIGSKLGSTAGSILGLELEGLSPEDQEFEVAKQVVRLGGEAVKQAAKTSKSTPPQAAAQKAMVKAAKKHAPGLVGQAARTPASYMPTGARRSGRWVKRGNKVILHGL